MLAAMQAAEQFLPLVQRFRLPPTALRLALAIAASERMGATLGRAAKSKNSIWFNACLVLRFPEVLAVF